MIKGKLIDDCYEYRILSMNIEVNQKLGMNNIPVCVPDHIKYHLEVESDRHPHFLYCIAQTVRRDLIQLKFESPRLGEKGRVFNLYDCIVPKFEEEFNHTTGEPLKMKLTLVAGMSYLNGEFMERLEWCRFNRDLIDKDPMVFTPERAREVLGEDITTSHAPQKEQLLIKKLEGPFTEDGSKAQELIMGNTYIYKVTEYNTGEGDKLNSTNWSVELNNSGKLNQLDKSNAFIDKGTICYKYTPEKAENIRIYAWCNEATKDVSVDVPVVCFPFCVDKFRMPGLNSEGNDIAEDLTYGTGVNTTKKVYPEADVESFKSNYINRKEFGLTALSNRNSNYNKAFYTFQEAYNIDYDIKWYEFLLVELPGTAVNWVASKLMDLPENISAGALVKFFNEKYSDDDLFNLFEEIVTKYMAKDELKENIIAMIHKFKRNEGGVYKSELLTKNIENHPSTNTYCEELQDYIAEKLKTGNGKVSDLIETEIDWAVKEAYDIRRRKGKTTTRKNKKGDEIFFLRPQYNTTKRF